MASHYHQLCAEERACIMQMTAQGHSLRQIAALLRRAPSSISREIRRHTTATVAYDAAVAGRQARQRRRQPRRPRKLQPHSAAFLVVTLLLHQGWSPQQIQGRLRERYPDDPNYHVSHETIYAAIYATPRGELRKELIRCLRQGHDGRRKRSQGEDRRGRLPDMVSILSIRMNSASNSYFKTSMPSHLKAITITHFKSATHSRGNAATQL